MKMPMKQGNREPQHGLELQIGWLSGIGGGRSVPPIVKETCAREQLRRICTDHDGPLSNDPKRCAASPRIVPMRIRAGWFVQRLMKSEKKID